MTKYILLLRPYQWLKNVFAVLDVSIIATAFMNESSPDVWKQAVSALFNTLTEKICV